MDMVAKAKVKQKFIDLNSVIEYTSRVLQLKNWRGGVTFLHYHIEWAG